MCTQSIDAILPKSARVAIVGAGAVGSYYGGRLAEVGIDVHFLLRSDFDQVSRHGVLVESSAGDFFLPHPQIYRQAEDIGVVDLVIVAWKSTANANLPAVLAPLVGERTLVLTLQNGLGNVEAIQNIVGKERVLGGLCFVCINRLKPGLIRHSGAGLVMLGDPLGGKTDRLLAVERLFQFAKIPTRAVENLEEAQWRKLVWNIPFNGLCVTEGGIDTEELLSRPTAEERIRALMGEVIEAAACFGHQIEPDFIDAQIAVTRPMGKYRPSTMLDFIEGRGMELEAIWGEPLRRAKEKGLHLPELERLWEGLKGMVS